MRISDWSSDVCSSDLWFVVHSSTMALLDLQITSHADTAVELTVYPFMRNGGRAYQQVTPHGDHLIFEHQEYPDAWTLGHDVPYTDSIRNVWVTSARPTRLGAFTSEAGAPFRVPNTLENDRKTPTLDKTPCR